MRWAIIGAKGPDTLEYHLEDSLKHLGHEVKLFDILFPVYGFAAHYWMRRVSKKYDLAKAKKLAADILAFKPDVVLGTYRVIHPVTIDIIKQANPSIVTMHMNPDTLVNLEQQQIIASSYDYLFTKDPYIQRFLKEKAKLNAYYLPEAFNPRYHYTDPIERSRAEEETNIDVLVFGNLYPYRVRLVEQLLKYKFKIQLYGVEGPFFPQRLRSVFLNRVILGKEKAATIWGSKIVFNNFHYAEIEGVNCKYFEINGMGGFQICDFKPTLKEYSPIEPNRYSFNQIEEAIDMMDRYLHNREERFEMARQQRDHFLAHHTYEHRMNSIIQLMGLNQ